MNEEDIKKELSKSSSQYGFHKEKAKPADFTLPERVGTNYVKANAVKDITSPEREQFWAKVSLPFVHLFWD